MFDMRSARARLSGALVVALATTMLIGSASVAHAGLVTWTAKTFDTGNGRIDRIVVTFSTPMSQSQTPTISGGPGQPGFRVEGYPISTIAWAGTTDPDKLFLNLVEKSAPDGAATPTVVYESGGNAESTLGIEADALNKAATDGAGPVLLEVRVRDQAPVGVFNRSGGEGTQRDEATLVWSEPATLAGSTPTARWTNLEKAIKLNNEGGGCAADGQGSIDIFNFPQPDLTKTAPGDGILEPEDSSTLTSTFRLAQVPNTIGSSHKFPGVPAGCWLGIEPGVINTGFIEDAAGNTAIRQVTASPVLKVYPTPVDAQLLFARTKDLDADGALDGIELWFDQVIDEETFPGIAATSVALGPTSAILDVDGATFAIVGGNPAPNVILVPFATPTGVIWDTGVQPTVRYTKPSGCSSTEGGGLKAILPSGGTHRACVGSFDVEARDGAAPLVGSAVTTDGDLDGRLDRVTVTFTEVITQGHPAGWTLNGNPATGFTILAGGRSAEIPISEGVTGDTGSSAELTYTAQPDAQETRDAWENEVLAATVTATDGAAPRIETATLGDTDSDGNIDRAVLVYSEPIVDPGSGAAAKFEIGGVPATGFAPGEGDVANDEVLTLAVNAPGTEPKDVTFSGGQIADALGNTAGDQLIDATEVIDEAAPLATIDIAPTAPLGVGTSTITLTFTEEMDTATLPSVALGTLTVNPATTDHTNGFRNADPTVWEGTVDIAEGDCTTSTGCAVSASVADALDLAGNANAAAERATEIDTIAPQTPVIGTLSSGFAPGGSAPANAINADTRSITLDADVLAGDAAGGRAEILVDGSVLPNSQVAPIGEGDTTVLPSRTFASLDELSGALPDSTLPFAVRVCDDAENCTDSASFDVLVDYTAIDVSLLSPGDGVTTGGDVVSIAWDGDETAGDLDRVELELSHDDGTTFDTTIASDQTAADGSYDWTVPAMDVATARVRAVTVDAAGNRSFGVGAESFSIDSTPPVVAVDGVGAQSPFVPAGETADVRWTATDATLHRAADPITIEYSADGGTTWQEINGGSYSHADDGVEAWSVPGGTNLDLLVRVTATDATGAATTVASSRLAAGVAGYVARAKGDVVPFGTAEGGAEEGRLKRANWLAGMALAPNGVTGYTMSKRGALYPFAIGDVNTPKTRTLGLPAGSARDVVLLTKSSGYVLDEHGELHRFGKAPRAHESRIFSGDKARALFLTADGTGGYVLHARGKLFPFAIGKADTPPKIGGKAAFRRAVAEDFVVNSDGSSGYYMRGDGKLVPFGGAPKLAWKPKGDAVALVRLTDTAGYRIDTDGTVRPYGDAFGDPTRATFSRYGARAAVGA